ncbi:MAG: M48 family metallopeptidase [Candidatus Niyogibacteria bacterium]|nr:M48 family metallopeptidase [Candidatus Niyogibacteria bacterium]
MASLYTHQESNIRKTWLLFALFFGVVTAVGFVFGQLYNNPGILYFAVFFSVAMSITSYWFSDRIVLATSHADPVSKQNAPELYNIVENLAITAGLPTPKIYLIKEASPNAFATGRDAQHAVVAVTSGLLDILDRSELEGVLAHEMSHIGNRDMLVSTVAVVLVGFVALLSDMFLRSMFWGSFGGDRDDRGRNGAIIVLIGIILAILAPIAASLMQLAISRKREFLADASGAMLTRYPEGLASALQKISQNHAPMKYANNATAHLFIANPFKGGSGKHWFAGLFLTHPPIEDRIAILRGMKI